MDSLSMGNHIITLVAVDSDKNRVQSSVQISVSALSDSDNDGIPDDRDNCRYLNNPDQADSDSDGTGNLCDDDDSDHDGFPDRNDNCPAIFNDQTDQDGDGTGDACDDCTDPTPEEKDNILINGCFRECTLSPWVLWTATDQGASASITFKNGTSTISGISIPKNPVYWHIQLIQPFSAGQLAKMEKEAWYRLSFDASVLSGQKNCHIYFGLNEDPWTDILDTIITVGSQKKRYEFFFPYLTDLASVKVAVDLGADTIQLNLDNLYLKKLIGTTDEMSICQGQSYHGWSASGTYSMINRSDTGQDTVVTTVLTVNPVFKTTQYKTICVGQKYQGWNSPGTYTQTFQSKSGCDSLVTTNLQLFPLNQPVVAVRGDTLTTSGTYLDYQWHDEKGKIEGAKSNRFIISKSGKYYLEVLDGNSCYNTSATASVIFSNNRDMEFSGLRFSVVPNPCREEFLFRLDSARDKEIMLRLVTPLGQLISVKTIGHQFSEQSVQFNVAHLSRGIYYLIIINEKNQKTEKIIVQ
jgi:hypothetical protein